MEKKQEQGKMEKERLDDKLIETEKKIKNWKEAKRMKD